MQILGRVEGRNGEKGEDVLAFHTQDMSLQPLDLPDPCFSFTCDFFGGQNSSTREGQGTRQIDRARFWALYMVTGQAFLETAGQIMKARYCSREKEFGILLSFYFPKQASSMLLMHFRWSNFP